jgi:ligand-binding sensor domain-containing protein/signal transduction histidine kinase
LRSLNIFHERSSKWRWLFRWLLVGFITIGFINTAHAIDPNRALSQYIHDRWGTENGFPGGQVYAITQTTDGYLWFGTESGLVRFDGLNFRLIRDLNPASPNTGPIFGLVADHDGNLWVRSWGPMMLRYRDGELKNVRWDLGWSYSSVTAMYEANNGALLFSEMGSGTIKYHNKMFETLVPTTALPRSPVISMAETPDGDIWMGTRDAGLFRLSGQQTFAITKGLTDQKINCLLPNSDGKLWVGTDNGVVIWNGSELIKSDMSSSLSQVQILAMNRDRDSNIWIGTANGLVRVNAKGISSFDERNRRPGGAVTALFEDREGNLWVGSTQGIERFRDGVFMTYSVSEGMPSENNGPVYIDSEGRTWFAPSDGGLYWLKDGQIQRVTTAGLNADVIYSISGSKDELWIGRQRGGLTHLRFQGQSITAKSYTKTQGLAQNSVYAVYQSREGTLWAGTLSGGVSQLIDGKLTTYTATNGLVSNTITSILEGVDGTMWFATPNGLSRLSKGQWQSYTAREGLPSPNVNCLFEDSSKELWVGTGNGLALLRSGRVYPLVEMPAVLHGQILGIAEDKKGWLWIATSNHVLQVARNKLLSGELSDTDIRDYGLKDGLHGIEGVKRHRAVVADSSGRIWFSMNRGLSVVDSTRLSSTSVPAMVHIQAISVNGNPINLRNQVRLPAGQQRLTFSYTGLSFAVPERVKFRYMLDGFDHAWSEPSTIPEAIYTNLSPGSYQFHVVACNSDGIWNSTEATIRFEIMPRFWQTWWFQLSGGVVCVLVLLALYRFRLYRLMQQLNVRFEERLAERTRIAQDLHDTLLQGFLSTSMQLYVAADQLPADSPAKPQLNRVLQLMRQVIDEGRNAVSGLRSSDMNSQDLAQAFSRTRQELAIEDQVKFRVIVEGQIRPLHPIIRDEVYRIGREALVNAFRHSKARSIEVEVEYARNYLRIFVRDDGCGIDPQVLQSGREGHWGLSGMRERAERIGARLNVRSRIANGTEVELHVQGQIAFRFQSSNGLLKRFRKWIARKPGADIAEARKREIDE